MNLSDQFLKLFKDLVSTVSCNNVFHSLVIRLVKNHLSITIVLN